MSRDFSSKERLENVAKYLKTDILGLCSIIKVSFGIVKPTIMEGSKIDSRVIRKITSLFPEISNTWLITGDGSMTSGFNPNKRILNLIEKKFGIIDLNNTTKLEPISNEIGVGVLKLHSILSNKVQIDSSTASRFSKYFKIPIDVILDEIKSPSIEETDGIDDNEVRDVKDDKKYGPIYLLVKDKLNKYSSINSFCLSNNLGVTYFKNQLLTENPILTNKYSEKLERILDIDLSKYKSNYDKKLDVTEDSDRIKLILDLSHVLGYKDNLHNFFKDIKVDKNVFNKYGYNKEMELPDEYVSDILFESYRLIDPSNNSCKPISYYFNKIKKTKLFVNYKSDDGIPVYKDIIENDLEYDLKIRGIDMGHGKFFRMEYDWNDRSLKIFLENFTNYLVTISDKISIPIRYVGGTYLGRYIKSMLDSRDKLLKSTINIKSIKSKYNSAMEKLKESMTPEEYEIFKSIDIRDITE